MRLLRLLLVSFVCLLTMGCGSHPSINGANIAYPEVKNLEVESARSFDPSIGEEGLIRYELSTASMVRIRIVDSTTPSIIRRTLIGWAQREQGWQSERWNGQDQHGAVLDPRSVTFVIVAEPIRTRLSSSEADALASLSHPEHKHFLHDSAKCYDLDVHLLAPTEGTTVTGILNIAATLGDRQGMPDSEYHLSIFIDGRAAWDNRVPDNQVSISFDTRNLSNGEHNLAVCFNDLHDHAGSDYVNIVVANQ